MKKIIQRIAASVMSFVMVMSVGVIPVNADTHNDLNDATMQPKTVVYKIGEKSFYKVNDDGSIVFADREEDETYEAVPSAYIFGSEYNEGNWEYGMYAVSVNSGVNNAMNYEIHVVKIVDCLKLGEVYYYDHGTKSSATVSDEVDTATNSDPTMSTDFYINIENGIDPDGVTKEDVVIGAADDTRVSYEITVATKTTYQLKATVPMYVCMYGYRGTGNVVTPTEQSYQMKNYSTLNENAEAKIAEIVKLTQYTQVVDEDHSNERIHTVAFTDRGEYVWWYSAPEINAGDYVSVFNLVDNGYIINASGENYIAYIGDTWYVAAAGTLDNGVLRENVNAIDADFPLKEAFTFGNWSFGTEFAVSAVGTKIDTTVEDVVGLPIKVTEIQAEPATWKLVKANTSVGSLKRGEIVMTLTPEYAGYDASSIDLATCSAPVDISERGWFLFAPTVVDGEVTEPTALGLDTYAQIAGGNVNDSGCVPVVKVSYTIIPIFGELGVSEDLKVAM